MNPDELLWLAEQASRAKTIVEIGSWLGRSTRAMADNTEGTIYAVDLFDRVWEESPEDSILPPKRSDVKADFCRNLEGYIGNRVNVVQASSVDAAKQLANLEFDFCFIDAGHDYPNVKADLQAWMPLVKGTISGHDYSTEEKPYSVGRDRCVNLGVVKAVNEMLPNVKFGPGSIWYAEL